MIRTPEELEDDSDFEQEDYDARSRTSVQTEDDQLIAGQSAREKCKLDAEVAKWDDNGNDIICPDSACKQDLLAYLQRIALYCHQLNICSKVKAEVQNLGGELIVSGYQKVYGTAAVNSPVVSWRMKAPEKKPLVKREKPEECQTRVRRGSQKKHISPVQALSEFKAMDSF
ncbi:hypothetical protein CRUP_026594 [Coryphaenoides rupestris]|nr:hypothetical protein CRUP_026594 [Coryphaenoides rupestris]